MAQAVGPDTDGNIPGSNNGEGVGVLVSRTGGIWNTGTGFEALNHLTAGNQNTARGIRALFSDTNGGYNTATGVYSLFANISGFYNRATGAYARTKTSATRIQPTVIQRSISTPKATLTRQSVMVRSIRNTIFNGNIALGAARWSQSYHWRKTSISAILVLLVNQA